jgi:hypothetical protein
MTYEEILDQSREEREAVSEAYKAEREQARAQQKVYDQARIERAELEAQEREARRERELEFLGGDGSMDFRTFCHRRNNMSKLDE